MSHSDSKSSTDNPELNPLLALWSASEGDGVPVLHFADSTAGQVAGGLRLAGDTFEQATSRVREFHRAISDMPFKAVGFATASASKPIEMVHNEVTDLVYDVVKDTGRGVLHGAAWLLEQASHSLSSVGTLNKAMDGELVKHADAQADAFPAEVRTKSRKNMAMVASALNGLVGDHLAATRNPIQVKAGFYQRGHLVDLSAQGLQYHIPHAEPNVVVFVHGLCCNEEAWDFYHRPEDPNTRPYGDKLSEAFPITPLFLRYNTGLSVQSNARNLKRLLKRAVLNWPVPVQSVALVGHSMGGLVCRQMVQGLTADDAQLTDLLRDVVSLGTPHAGAPLARLAGAGEALLSKLDLTKPLANVLGVRSTGIRDLQEGLGPLQTQDGHEIRFHFMGSTVADSTGSWLNETLGDGLVQMSSALADDSGKAQRLAFAAKHHMNLLNDIDIYLQLEAVVRQYLRPRHNPLNLPLK